MLYPLVMQPHFRHGAQTPWGGDSLAMFGKQIPDDRTGESLEISALAGTPSLVKNGPLAGRSLHSLVEEYGARLTGCEGEFPLLVKLIDARDMLSVQVHPGDEYAREKHGKLGKTEAWLVLSCAPGAQLCCGIREDAAPFAQLCADEQAMQQAMRRVSVQPGDVLYIPHGLVHALGGGIMVYEIQQSSDVTYRISDWGRLGTDGQPRQLHLEDALAVVRPQIRPDKACGASLVVEGGVQTAYVCDERFELWRLNISG
ncbi:MAG: class I mannose-6-phosphate isomerase, partial [Eubacteriales bacterium]|nr:class I mannose-6-phosphate isomerase [Eubacteriales bacterium]